MIVALRNPNRDDAGPIQTDLGRRPEDLDHEWLRRHVQIEIDQSVQHIESVHGTFNGDPAPPSSLNAAGDPNSLNTEQRAVFDRVIGHYLQKNGGQVLLHVDGVAGTGKSRVIDMISNHLAYHAAQRGTYNPVMRGAPTSIAAHTIHSSTLHRLYSLPVKKDFHELSEERLSRLQDQFRHCWLLLSDEKSMIGAQILHQIDRRLRQIRCSHDDFFGGLKYPFLCNKEDVKAGLRAYAAFDQTIVLTQIMRQQGTSAEAIQFRNSQPTTSP